MNTTPRDGSPDAITGVGLGRSSAGGPSRDAIAAELDRVHLKGPHLLDEVPDPKRRNETVPNPIQQAHLEGWVEALEWVLGRDPRSYMERQLAARTARLREAEARDQERREREVARRAAEAEARHDWVVCENTPAGGYLNRCLRCQATETLAMPMAVTEFVRRSKAFEIVHAHCEPPAATHPEGTE